MTPATGSLPRTTSVLPDSTTTGAALWLTTSNTDRGPGRDDDDRNTRNSFGTEAVHVPNAPTQARP